MKFMLKAVLVYWFASAAVAGEKHILSPEHDPHLNIVLGVSPFLGVLGIEYQHGNHAFGLGFPGRLAYRYFIDPYSDSVFLGGYLGRYSIDEYDEREKGILFEEKESSYYGVGAGYRWQWQAGWNVTTSLAIERYENEYSNQGAMSKLKETGTSLLVGLNVGYKF
ncbi:MAG: hypothetical protein ACJA0N_000704 [Pseudohongiellaceae bacterium]|jgi:hypothetical protein